MSQLVHRGARTLVPVLCVVLTLTGCRLGNVERIRSGPEVSDDGERLQLAGLQPRCGCISLTNRTDHPIWVESRYYGRRLGSVVLEKREASVRVKFDWGGPENTDLYEVVAFNAQQDPTTREWSAISTQGLLVDDALFYDYPPFVMISCTETDCDWGSLAMNRVYLSPLGQERLSSRRRGVNFTSVLEVSSTMGTCGCLMLRNTTDTHRVALRSTLNGRVTGEIDVEPRENVFVAFDWAGPSEIDAYTVEAVDVETVGQRSETPVPGLATVNSARTVSPVAGTTSRLPANQSPQGAGSASPPQSDQVAGNVSPDRPDTSPRLSVRLADYISVVGQMVNMTCRPEYSEFIPFPQIALKPGGELSQNASPAAPSSGGAGRQQSGASAASAAPTLPQTAAGMMGATTVIRCPWFPGDGLGMYRAYDPTDTTVRAATAELTKKLEAELKKTQEAAKPGGKP